MNTDKNKMMGNNSIGSLTVYQPEAGPFSSTLRSESVQKSNLQGLTEMLELMGWCLGDSELYTVFKPTDEVFKAHPEIFQKYKGEWGERRRETKTLSDKEIKAILENPELMFQLPSMDLTKYNDRQEKLTQLATVLQRTLEKANKPVGQILKDDKN